MSDEGHINPLAVTTQDENVRDAEAVSINLETAATATATASIPKANSPDTSHDEHDEEHVNLF